MRRCCGRQLCQTGWTRLQGRPALFTPPFALVTRTAYHSSATGGTPPPPSAASSQPPQPPTPSQSVHSPSVPPQPPRFTLDDFLAEVQGVTTRVTLIGNVFRQLSPSARQVLLRNRITLEELLLHYPEHIVLFRVGRGVNTGRTKVDVIYVAPPYLVPTTARVMRLAADAPPRTVDGVVLPCPTTPSTVREAAGGAAVVAGEGEQLLDASPQTVQERLEEVLQYIPNEWTLFERLGVPVDVKVRCMGYPSVKVRQFFSRYPQYFEIRAQDRASHSFHVRRSLRLQQEIAAHTAGRGAGPYRH